MAPKGIVPAIDKSSAGTRPGRAQEGDIVYEAHVRGLAENDPDVPARYRGTCQSAALKAGYLASPGVTAVEFLPLQETRHGAKDVKPRSTDRVNHRG